MSQANAEWTANQQERSHDQVTNHKPTVKKSQVPTDGNCAAGDQECQDRTPPPPAGTLKPPTVESFVNSSVSLFYVGVVGAAAVLYACVCVWKRRRA